MWYVYILISLKDNRTYTGSTDNIERRLKEHNLGYVKSTKHRLPLEIFYIEKYNTEKGAHTRERYLKTCAGRKFVKALLK